MNNMPSPSTLSLSKKIKNRSSSMVAKEYSTTDKQIDMLFSQSFDTIVNEIEKECLNVQSQCDMDVKSFLKMIEIDCVKKKKCHFYPIGPHERLLMIENNFEIDDIPIERPPIISSNEERNSNMRDREINIYHRNIVDNELANDQNNPLINIINFPMMPIASNYISNFRHQYSNPINQIISTIQRTSNYLFNTDSNHLQNQQSNIPHYSTTPAVNNIVNNNLTQNQVSNMQTNSRWQSNNMIHQNQNQITNSRNEHRMISNSNSNVASQQQRDINSNTRQLNHTQYNNKGNQINNRKTNK